MNMKVSNILVKHLQKHAIRVVRHLTDPDNALERSVK